MSRRPFEPREIDEYGRDVDPTVADLERYLADSIGEPPHDFADRVMGTIAAEPLPRRGAFAFLTGALGATSGSLRSRMLLVAATIVLAVVTVVAAGQLGRLLPGGFGSSPVPSVPELSPSQPMPSPTPSAEPTMPISPTPSMSPSPEPTATESGSPDDSPSDSPEESDDNSGPGGDDDETPRPSESDHSGPGGGDDSSGPGEGGGGPG